jgi:flagellar hook protein FlgE
MSTFSTSLSGLDAEEQALSVISNDLSNLNTTAFKTGTPIFSDLFYQMLGSDGAGDPVQLGVGATMSSVDSPFTQGSITTTGVSTDVAIQGNGLFVMNQGGAQVYTRAGNFTLNAQGNLVDSNGNDVMGYSAVNGTINTSQSLAPIIISSGQSYPPNATSNVQLDMNLDATDTSLAPATGTLTVPAPALPTAGQTATIGGTTYTFAANITAQSAADTVKIGADAQSTLANLAGAINASSTNGQAAGTTYSSGTVANTSVTATSTATTLNLQAIDTGVDGNSLATSSQWTAGSFAAADLSGGVTAQLATGTLTVSASLPTAGQTVTVGGTTYTFAAAITAQSAADTVKIGADVPSTLANLAGAINLSSANGQAAGTTYSSATVANASVTATGSTATTVTLKAIQTGTGGNSLATSTTWTGGSFGAADLAGGVDGVAASGSYTVPIALPTAGQTATVGGTTYTFVGSVAALTAADTVLIGADVPSTLANLAGAINASTADGQAAGTTYGTGTVANTSVTATGSTSSTLTLQAIQSGSVGNTIATSTNWTAGSFGAGDLTGGTNAGTFSTPITVYDSLGNSHVLTFNFTKSAAGDWNYQITIPAADVGTTGNPQVVGTGTLQFGPEGNLISPPADVQGISVSGLADGAKAISLNWQLFSSPGTAVITQTAETSATSGTEQNGYSAGTLQSYSINSSGVIDGVLSNGQTVALGQIALATFANYDGLTNLGSNDFQTSLASGAASVAAPGTGGSGTLDGGSLEASNVDIATAFTMLIQAERGYEANAKAITTADDVMQASINLIQQ